MGDCLKAGGPPDRPEAAKVECGRAASNFKVVSTVQETDHCPSDVDSYYSMRSSFSNSGTTVCMDIDWVIGGCMSIDPTNGRDPVRVTPVRDGPWPDRARPRSCRRSRTSINAPPAGLRLRQRQFTVCVEDVS